MSVSTAELKVLISASSSADAVIKNFGGSLGGLEKQVSGISGAMGGAFKLAAGAAAAGGVAIAAGLGAGVKAAGDLQEAVAAVSTVKPDIDTSAVFKSLNEMSTKIPASATDMASALNNIFQNFDTTTAQGLAAVETFSKGAIGAQTDAATFGSGITGVLQAFGKNIEESSHVSDVFFNTIRDGAITGQQLASALGPVSQSAKQAGVSLEELGGLIVGVTREGGDASQNVNNLNNFLQKVTTKEAQKAMKDLGVAVVDSSGSFRKMPDIINDLKDKFGSLTEAEKANELQKIFPDAQARAGASVLISQIDQVNKSIEDNKTSVGSAEAAFEKMNATFNSQAKLLSNTLTSVLATVGSELLPLITPIISSFAKELPAAFATARAAVGEIGTALAAPFQTLKDAVATVSEVFAGTWGPSVEGAGAQVDPFVETVGRLALTLKNDVIPAVTAAAQWLGSSLPPAIASAQAAFNTLTSTIGPIVTDLRAGIDALVATVRDQLPPAAGEAAAGVNVLSVAFDLIAGAVKTMLAPIAAVAAAFRTITEAQAAVSAQAPQFGATIAAAFGSVASTVAGAFAALPELVGGFFSAMGTSAQAGIAAIGDAFSALGSSVQGAITAAGAAIIGAWESAVDAPTRALLSALVAAVGDLFGAMGALIGVKMSELGTLVNAGWTAASTFTSTALAAISAAVEAGWAVVTSAVSSAMTAILAAVTPGWADVSKSTETANNAVKTTVEGIWNALSGAIGTAMKAVSSTVTGAWNGIKSGVEGILASLVAVASSFGSGMVSAFGAGIKSGLDGVLATVRRMTSDIRALLPGSDAEYGPLSDLTASGRALPETLARGIIQSTPALMRVTEAMAAGASKAMAKTFIRQSPVVATTAVTTLSDYFSDRFKKIFPNTAATAVAGLSLNLINEFRKQLPAANTEGGTKMGTDLTQVLNRQFAGVARVSVASFTSDLAAEFNRQIPKVIDQANDVLRSSIEHVDWGSEGGSGDVIRNAVNDAVRHVDWGSEGGSGDVLRRQLGGIVKAGTPYIVGEKGPEMFVPRVSGDVLANGRFGGGGSTSTTDSHNITVNVTGVDPRDRGQMRAAALEATFELQRAGIA